MAVERTSYVGGVEKLRFSAVDREVLDREGILTDTDADADQEPEPEPDAELGGAPSATPGEFRFSRCTTEFYHGTSLEAALKIQDEGFRVDLSGTNAGKMLGPGLYCTTTLEKAVNCPSQPFPPRLFATTQTSRCVLPWSCEAEHIGFYYWLPVVCRREAHAWSRCHL